jgi:DNA-binding IclR family transcriptional regulator
MESSSKMRNAGETKANEPSRSLSGSVQRTLEVLEAVALVPGDIGISELATSLGQPKSSVHRFLANLEARGLVEQDPATSRYTVGLRLYGLAAGLSHKVQSGVGLPAATHAIFSQAVGDLGETGYVGVLDRGEVLYVDSVEGGEVVRATAPVGTRRPIYCTAVGKVLVSEMDQASRDQVLGGSSWERLTPHTVTDQEQFERDLVRIREQGYAIDVEEFSMGLTCLGAPIRDADGRMIAAVGVTGPAWRLEGAHLEAAVEALLHAAKAISAQTVDPKKALLP